MLKINNKWAWGMVIAYKGGNDNILFLDYDTNDNKFVEKDVKRLIKKFGLGDCELVKTRHGYHCFFFDDEGMDWEKIVEIIEKSKCDLQFKQFVKERGILRPRIRGKHKGDLKWKGRIKGKKKKNRQDAFKSIYFNFIR